jgi:predicted phage terminase large subunit-like protein
MDAPVDQRGTEAELFYLRNKADMDSGAEVLWQERENLYQLMTLRSAIGTASFASEKQNDPINPDLCEWPETYFTRPGFWFDTWPDDLVVKAIGLDPSKGSDSRVGDYSAIVKLGRDKQGVLYCEADVRRRNTEEICDDAIDANVHFRPDVFAVETNTFQELLARQIIQKAAASTMPIPIKGVTNNVNKNVRIRRLGPYFSQGIMRFKAGSAGTALLVQQLRDFPVGDHDDGPDALEIALREMITYYNDRNPRGKR